MSNHLLSRKALADRVNADYPAKAAFLFLRFGTCRVSVLANREEIIAELADYFADFLTEGPLADIRITVHECPPPALNIPLTDKRPDPGKRRIKEAYADLPDGRLVCKRLTGMGFLFGDGQHLAFGPCLDNLNQVVNFINNRYIEWRLCRDGLLGHAAGVAFDGRGLGLAGFSGAGKSTLALHLMRRDATFVSNDRLIVERLGESLYMYGVAKLPRINPGTALNNPNLSGILSDDDRRRFSALDGPELWALEHKLDAPIDTCFGAGKFIPESPMDVLAILNWKRDGGPTKIERVSIADRTDLLPAFMKSTGLFFLPDNRCRPIAPTEAAYIHHLSACKVLEVTGGIDFDAAADGCLSFIFG